MILDITFDIILRALNFRGENGNSFELNSLWCTGYHYLKMTQETRGRNRKYFISKYIGGEFIYQRFKLFS